MALGGRQLIPFNTRERKWLRTHLLKKFHTETTEWTKMKYKVKKIHELNDISF